MEGPRIHVAIQTHAMKEIKSFLKSCNSKTVNLPDGEGQTPLHLAAAQGMREIVVSLLKKKALVSAIDNLGWTPLHCAANFQHYEIAAILIEAKANIHALTNDKNSVLGYMVKGENKSPVRFKLLQQLLPKGINEKNMHHETPFTRACATSDYEIIKLLLQHNGSVNHQKFVLVFVIMVYIFSLN